MGKNYSIVIRTLGTGGGKYQQLLDSIKAQTLQPKHLLVFIAEGYELPPQQLGTEEFVYTRKGKKGRNMQDRNVWPLWGSDTCIIMKDLIDA